MKNKKKETEKRNKTVGKKKQRESVARKMSQDWSE